jgi:quercetin dioxygenase-like cupin family protein
MDGIFQVNGSDMDWHQYAEEIRVKALTMTASEEVPPVTYVEYAPNTTDPVHQHSTAEFFVVTKGELWIDDVKTDAGGLIYIAAKTDYATRAGAKGATFFRIVVR